MPCFCNINTKILLKVENLNEFPSKIAILFLFLKYDLFKVVINMVFLI